jgi:hypothetical protein
MFRLGVAVCSIAFLLALPAHAQGQRWVAVSTTAMAITGDIETSPGTLRFSTGDSLTLVPVAQQVQGQWQMFGAPTTADIYRVEPPSDPKLLQGNTLCGVPVTFMGVLRPGPDALILNVYSGEQPPRGEDPDLDNLCATFTYQAS